MTTIKISGAYITGLFDKQQTWIGDEASKQLLASDLNTYIFWSLHVTDDGDLRFNDVPLVTGGTPNSKVAGPIQQLIEEARSSANAEQVFFSIGAGGVSDWAHLEAILQGGGAPLANLKANLSALVALGVDGFDFDYEEDVADPVGTITGMAELLNSTYGSAITFCPYYSESFWIECLQKLQTKLGSQPVQAFNLQCYSGGGGNTPADWIQALADASGTGVTDAAAFVRPGLAVAKDSASPNYNPNAMESYLQGQSVTGAWIWNTKSVVDGKEYTIAHYATAIMNGVS